MIPIPEIIGNVVEKLRTIEGGAPYYMHGHPIEIANLLTEKSESSTFKFKKYPVIILFQDFDEDHTEGLISANLNFAIVTDTKATYEAGQRYENTFKQTLNPLFEAFIKQLKRSPYLAMNGEMFTFTKTDRLFWGRNDQSILADSIDAIEITNLNLTFITC